MMAGLGDATVRTGVFDGVGRVVLHGPVHAVESTNVVPLAYVVLGVVLVGFGGGLLFWYYERRAESA